MAEKGTIVATALGSVLVAMAGLAMAGDLAGFIGVFEGDVLFLTIAQTGVVMLLVAAIPSPAEPAQVTGD